MENGSSQSKYGSVGSIVLTIVLHGVLPFSWLVFALLVAPHMASSLSELSELSEPVGSGMNLILVASGLVGEFGLWFGAILASLLFGDGVIYVSLLRSNRKSATVWSLFVVLVEIGATLLMIFSVYTSILTLTDMGM